MFSGVWDAQAAKTGERTMAVSLRACHRGRLDWHMLGQITGAGVDGGLPWESQPVANRNPRKLGQTWALHLPWAPFHQLGRGAPGLRVYKYVNLTLRYWFPEIYIFTAFKTIKFFYHFSWHANIWGYEHVLISLGTSSPYSCNYCWLECRKKEGQR